MSATNSQRPGTLRRRIGRSFALLATVLTVLVAAVVASTTAFVLSGNAAVYRWEPAVAATQRVLTDLVDQETGLRGYALTHDKTSLQPYNAARVAEGGHTRRLAALIGGDNAVRRRLTALEAAKDRWHKLVADPIVAGLRRGDRAAQRLVAGHGAKQLFDALRASSAALVRLVDARAAAARHARALAGVIFLIAIGLTAVVLGAVAVVVWRGLHRLVLEPVDRLGAQTRLVAGGATYRPITPDGPAELSDLGRDVEAMRLQIAGQLARAEAIQDELRVRGEELARSNDDLQQFAYVASHDLSEPLRKVANFCQLLERQYASQLDDRARQYIDFAVDGAKRMQVLIADLLALSRVGRSTEAFAPVDLDAALDAALATLADQIAESDARVERRSPLPTVQGDPTLLASLLENLVGNAVKYRRPDVTPVVTVGAEFDATEREWTVTVADNGIGIDEQYAERVFVVFQRLHLRDVYGGTGIGLALGRRIVEFHGGRIWLDTVESSAGATFRFTIPEGAELAEPRD